MQMFEHSPILFGLKTNKSNCEIAGVGVLSKAQMAPCGMECVNLKTNAIKILGIYFFT